VPGEGVAHTAVHVDEAEAGAAPRTSTRSAPNVWVTSRAWGIVEAPYSPISAPPVPTVT
jgi:hypothetical protein